MPVNKSTSDRYDLCPVCGDYKRNIAKTCRKCRFFNMSYTPSGNDGIKWDTLTEVWLHQFRGLFWGEGSAMIVRNQGTYSAILALVLRADDRDVIDDIQAHLGGRVVRMNHPQKSGQGKPLYQWRVVDLQQVYEITQLLLRENVIPAKKVGDVERVRSFCQYRLPSRFRLLSDEQKAEMERMRLDLIEYRVYREK